VAIGNRANTGLNSIMINASFAAADSLIGNDSTIIINTINDQFDQVGAAEASAFYVKPIHEYQNHNPQTKMLVYCDVTHEICVYKKV